MMEIVILTGYNAVILELAIIGYWSWRYNGFASYGTRKYLGPFALVIAFNLMRLNTGWITEVAWDVELTRAWLYDPLVIVQTWAVVAIGALIIDHMRAQLRASRELVNRHYNGKGMT